MSERVSIVMLACDKSRYTRRTLESLLGSTHDAVEVVLLDNGSTDDTPAVFAGFAAEAGKRGWTVKRLHEAENIGAVAGRNRALAEVGGDYVVFLDNDVVLGVRSWMEKMIRALRAEPDIGILGPKILFAEGTNPIQQAGCTVCRGGRVVFRGRGAARDDPRYDEACDAQALISACWMMPKDVADALGPLDMRFHPVQFEDIDYCYRARAAGWRCRYDPAVFVYHFENVTTGDMPGTSYRYLTVKNGKKFKEKWREAIAAEGGPDDASVSWQEFPKVPFETVKELRIDD